MTHPETIANESGRLSEALLAQVESAAVQIILGALDSSERLALLRGLSEQATASERGDIAQIIDDALLSASNATDLAAADALLSDCIARVQSVLCNAGAEQASV